MLKFFSRVFIAAFISSACTQIAADPRYPGGETTTQVQGSNAFSQSAANLSFDERLNFSVGNSFFRNPWVTAPASTDARDGLGPIFNTNSCQGCHIKDGRGHPPREDQTHLVSTLIRVSIPETAERKREAHQAVIGEPIYGDQIQDFAIPGVTAEMRINWEWVPYVFTGADGKEYELRKPKITFDQLGYGEMHPETQFSPRVAPAMIGLGLLEAIPEQAIRANADPNDKNRDGITGRANEVWDAKTQTLTLGRYGWKAGQPNVEQQSAGAFLGDMGLSSSLNPGSPCTASQDSCLSAPTGGDPEVSDEILNLVVFYAKHLAPPARPSALDMEQLAGQKLFTEVGCANCHTPRWETGQSDSAALSNQIIYPYTDLLLHDMGDGLADNRSEFEANGQEWRTPPLWGLGDYIDVNGHTELLHDGRARNAFEAILWHGGEAASSRDKVLGLSERQQQSLLKFLNSL